MIEKRGVLRLSETKLRGEGKMNFGKIRGLEYWVGRRGRTIERVTVLLNDHI